MGRKGKNNNIAYSTQGQPVKFMAMAPRLLILVKQKQAAGKNALSFVLRTVPVPTGNSHRVRISAVLNLVLIYQ